MIFVLVIVSSVARSQPLRPNGNHSDLPDSISFGKLRFLNCLWTVVILHDRYSRIHGHFIAVSEVHEVAPIAEAATDAVPEIAVVSVDDVSVAEPVEAEAPSQVYLPPAPEMAISIASLAAEELAAPVLAVVALEKELVAEPVVEEVVEIQKPVVEEVIVLPQSVPAVELPSIEYFPPVLNPIAPAVAPVVEEVVSIVEVKPEVIEEVVVVPETEPVVEQVVVVPEPEAVVEQVVVT